MALKARCGGDREVVLQQSAAWRDDLAIDVLASGLRVSTIPPYHQVLIGNTVISHSGIPLTTRYSGNGKIIV